MAMYADNTAIREIVGAITPCEAGRYAPVSLLTNFI